LFAFQLARFTRNMTLRIPKTISLFDLRREWKRTRRFSPHGFKLLLETQRGVQHWQGGPPIHRGAKCQGCKQPLMLIWDIALHDGQFPKFLAEAFAPIERLPLYFCAKCGACSYRLTSEKAIQCFEPDKDGDESPFAEMPAELDRRRIAFARIPSPVDGILTLEDTIRFEWLDAAAVKVLHEYYGRPIKSTWDMPFSQFGGQPLFTQGHQQIVCPNQKCPASKLEHPYPDLDRDFLMKELAVVEGDADPELQKAYSQIAYHICCTCFAIHSQYRCS
jgi:hypothetical protein